MAQFRLILTFVFLFAPIEISYGKDGKKSLIRTCVNDFIRSSVEESKERVTGSGEVTCPAADIVGFPPRERKHNRDSTVVLKAGSGRAFCENPNMQVQSISTNNGWNDPPVIENGRTEIRVGIHCRGANIGQGRTWHKISITADACKRPSEEQILDFTLECAQKLSE